MGFKSAKVQLHQGQGFDNVHGLMAFLSLVQQSSNIRSAPSSSRRKSSPSKLIHLLIDKIIHLRVHTGR